MLKGRTVIITGAAGGIGEETCKLFAENGARLLLVDLNPKGEKLAAELRGQGCEAYFLRTDITERKDVATMVADTCDRFGGIDVLINNAAITRDALLSKMSAVQWEEVLQVNLSGIFNCCQAVLPVMEKQGKGKIINTSSVVGIYGNIGQVNYATTKAGVIGLSKTLAKELGRRGISVNVVAPGIIETEMSASIPEKVLQKMREKCPLGRLGKPLDVAEVYLFLASTKSDFINGAVISVDGGLVL